MNMPEQWLHGLNKMLNDSVSQAGNSKAHGAKRKELTDKTTTDNGPQKPVSRMQQRAKSRTQRDNGLMTAGQSIHDLQSSILTPQYSVLFTGLLIADG